ncbi:hypothetical protein DL240_12640 [Lujinxingia litoralis]|uniref:non-specific serine/threonine protein kinase n=1 Tax=Lujinxingia litoralis TaxID=2211119 RepID=A0A328C527_9DELT|nr:serine/threonine-protein kinase [Lujinxingia litoralis]RAL21695.1 hypothetical protein DL240_12640 [Lujinxingia litoralis]
MRLDDLMGRVIAGRFELKDLIGKGGYGAVFEARQLSVDRRCAVKVLLPGRADDHSVEERFRAEARATSRLTHPHTLVLYDFGVDTETGFLFLVTEFLDGQSLDELLDAEQALSPARAVAILEQIAQSLHDAHEQGLVHRDVKPKNIMLVERAGKRDFVKVIDFGIAKALTGAGEDEGLTQTGTLVGTPQYMAPEQLLGSEVDARSDQYALAVVAYRMLTGRNPFAAAAPMETALRHLNERALPLRTYCPELQVGPAFEDALLKALEKSPKHRYASVVAMVDALKEALGDVGPEEESGQRTTEDWPLLSAQMANVRTRVLEAVTTGEVLTEAAAPVREASGAGASAHKGDEAPVEAREEDGDVESVEAREERGEGCELALSQDEEAAVVTTGADEVPRADPATTDQVIPTVLKVESAGDDTAVIRAAAVAAEATGAVASGRGQRRLWGARLRPSLAAVLVAMVGLVSLVVVTGFLGRGGGETEAAPREVELEADEGPPVRHVLTQVQTEAGGQVARSREVARSAAFRLGAERSAAQRALVSVSIAGEVAALYDESRPKMGTLQVTLIPWGTLYVGSRARGDATRQRLRLPEGRHQLTLRQHGQVRARQTVDVVAGAHRMVVLEAPF